MADLEQQAKKLLLSFYGDDFTGSTDVMESLALNGIPTALFLQPPSPEEVQRFRLKARVGCLPGQDRLKAFGVAGIARSWSPQEMQEKLPVIFEQISCIPSTFFQYKVCSTFDSAPQIGNIGIATDIALRYFPSDFVPLVIGAPFLNRFVLFGNLFARIGQETYRLDRHPVMARHPVTPMDESDLRCHLARQTSRPVALMDIFALEGAYGDPLKYLNKLKKTASPFILFDTLQKEHLLKVGKLLNAVTSERTQLIVGASGTDYALAFYWQQTGIAQSLESIPTTGKANAMMVAAGSCSSTTAAQIDYLERKGHRGVRINSLDLIDPLLRNEVLENARDAALKAIAKGQIPVLYTAKGPDDPLIAATKTRLQAAGKPAGHSNTLLAGAQAAILKEVISRVGKLRVVVAGGDTSGYLSRALGIYALETLVPIAPGAPLCLAHAKDDHYDGLEISLKGGQNGKENYFEAIQMGKAIP